MSELLFDVLVGVVIIISIIITKYLVPYFKAQIQDTQYAVVLDIIEKAVHSAEQTIKESGQGKVKKAQVLDFVSEWLASKNIDITEYQLDQLIEASVYAMNQAKEDK